jgi:hypothetical protein
VLPVDEGTLSYSVHAKHDKLVYIACPQRQPSKAAPSVRSVSKQSQNIVAQLVQFDSESSCSRGGSSDATSCSVACYKQHKGRFASWCYIVVADSVENACTISKTTAAHAPAPILDAAGGPSAASTTQDTKADARNNEETPLKPLTDISWPPEPDSSVFTDPLKRDDPKPLRREALMRIGEYLAADLS